MEIIPYSKQGNELVKPPKVLGAGWSIKVVAQRCETDELVLGWPALSLNRLEVGNQGSKACVGSLLFGGVLGVE